MYALLIDRLITQLFTKHDLRRIDIEVAMFPHFPICVPEMAVVLDLLNEAMPLHDSKECRYLVIVGLDSNPVHEGANNTVRRLAPGFYPVEEQFQKILGVGHRTVKDRGEFTNQAGKVRRPHDTQDRLETMRLVNYCPSIGVTRNEPDSVTELFEVEKDSGAFFWPRLVAVALNDGGDGKVQNPLQLTRVVRKA